MNIECVIDGCENAIQGRATKYARCVDHKTTCRRPDCDRPTTGSNSLCNTDSCYFYRTGELPSRCDVYKCYKMTFMGTRCKDHRNDSVALKAVADAGVDDFAALLRAKGYTVTPPVGISKEAAAPTNWGDF